MNISELLKIIAEGESTSIEFKRTLSRESAKDITAFLNTRGGILIYGIDDDGTIVGVTDNSEPDRILESIEPKPFNMITNERIKVDDHTIMISRIKKSQRMHMYRKTVYMRIGTMNKPLSVEDILEKASESMMLKFDEMGNRRARIDDLDMDMVRTYFIKRSQYRNIDIPENNDEVNLDFIGATIRTNGDRTPTNAGLLFFCKNPQRFILQSSLRVIFFRDHGMMESTDNRIFEGPLPDMVEKAINFIDRHIPLGSKLEEGNISRTTRKSYPLLAIREALINSLTHRNYFDSADVRVFIFPDSMEIINPGGFPPGVTPDDPKHKPRNPQISQYFFDLGYIEKYGMGLRRMKQACLEFGISPPEFILRESETKVIFFSRGNDNIGSRILSMIDIKGQVTSGEIVKEIGVSRDTANRYLRTLLEDDKIKRIGKGRAIKYVK